jgi:hypothetical protein
MDQSCINQLLKSRPLVQCQCGPLLLALGGKHVLVGGVAIQHEALPKFGIGVLTWKAKEGLHIQWHSVLVPVQGHRANEVEFVVRSAG